MNCTKCSHPLQEGELFCKHCGHQFAVAEQREKIAAAKAKTKGVLAANLHSVIFLIFTICFTVMFVTTTINMFTGGVTTILSGILPFIFMLIAVIGLWKSYSVKSADDLHKASLKKDNATGYFYAFSVSSDSEITFYLDNSDDYSMTVNCIRGEIPSQYSTDEELKLDDKGRAYITISALSGDELVINLSVKPVGGKYPAADIEWSATLS